MPKENRVKALGDAKYKDMFSKETLEHLKTAKEAEQYNIIKGSIEFGNIIGSVLGLAIFAPQVSHLIVHPVLKAIGMEEKHAEKDD